MKITEAKLRKAYRAGNMASRKAGGDIVRRSWDKVSLKNLPKLRLKMFEDGFAGC
jgi:hypothetical protein